MIGWSGRLLAVGLTASTSCEPKTEPSPPSPPLGSAAAPSAAPSLAVEDAPPGPTASATAAPAAPPCPLEMALIPEAAFAVSDGTPPPARRPTRVAAFCLDRTEVTTEAFSACVASGGCTAPLRGGSCTYERAGTAKQPINCVGFEQASAYCRARGRRLPTEAEWESAAGRGARLYPWGDAPPGKGVCWDGAENALGHGNRHDSCPVGTFADDVTPEGVLDLGGNVTEWTVPPEAPAPGDDIDQKGVRRGGTWGTKSGPFLLRTTSRRVGDYRAYQSGIFTGFRCAMDLPTRTP